MRVNQSSCQIRRKSRFLTILFFLAIIPLTGAEYSAAPAADVDGVQLLMTGDFHGDEVTARSGERWLALTTGAKGARLVQVTLKVEVVFDPIVDREGQKSGKRVSTDPPLNVLFLVRGDALLKPGPIKTLLPGKICLDLKKDLRLGSCNGVD